MRTTASSQWVWIFAGALPALSLGAGCGDDTAATTTGTSAGGFGGSGGDDNTTPSSSSASGSPTSSSSSSSAQSSSQSSAQSQSASSGGEGGAGAGGGTGGTGGSGGTGGGATCGNDLLDDGETCDGAELGGVTCADEGFVGGTLGCNADCELDTSGCTTCGDGVVDSGDECDGDDVGGNNCSDVDPDFISGTLACASDCTFDLDLCVGALCDDNAINGNEECDGVLLGGEDCVTQGFVSGTLACSSPSCQFDTSGCESCGNDAIDGDDVCDGTDLGGATCTTVPGNFTGGTLGCAVGCAALDTSACTAFPQPGVGELVISELMINPNGTNNDFPDTTAEWIEVTNPSVGTTYQLRDCVLSSNGVDETFDVDLSVAPGEAITLAKLIPGFIADFTYPNGFNLSQSDDFVTITCGADEVDTVAYSSATGFTGLPTGASIQLDPGFTSASQNGDGDNWCNSATIGAGFTSGDFGTPGEANPSCGVAPEFTINFCELQSPLTITGVEGTSSTVFGQVRIDGLTNLTDSNDLNALVLASVGFGPDGTDPDGNVSWQFTAATPNAGYNSGSPGYTVNQDEYQATFNIPAAAGSPYDYAFRFSGDGGTTWTYCDSTGGAYTPADAGQMTSTPSNQTFDLYFSEYVEGEPGTNKALEIYNAGADDIDLSACQIRLYRNGAATFLAANTLALSGTVAPGATWVVCSEGQTHFDVALCNATEADAMDFNGDDALELVCSSIVQDVIGQHIGVDPGAGWGISPTDTVNVMLRRNCPHVSDTDGTDAFVPAAAWTGTNYLIATADDDLGIFSGCP